MTTTGSDSKYRLPPQREPDAQSFDTRAKQVGAWLEALPKGNTGETTRMVFRALTELNGLVLAPADRFRVLELFHPAIDAITETLQRHFVGRPLPLGEKNLRVVAVLQELLIAMATGYKAVIHACLQGAGKRIEKHMLATAVFRNMRYLDSIQLHAYQIYAHFPDNTWRELHQLFLFAEQSSLSTLPIRDETLKHRKSISIEQLYKGSLLLSLACPYRLHQGEVDRVKEWLEEWVDLVRLHKPGDAGAEAAIFLTQMNGDYAPTYRHMLEGAEQTQLLRMLDTEELATHLRSQLPEEDPATTTGVFDREAMRRDLLRRLALAWAVSPQRANKRLNVSSNVQAATGLTSVYQLISGGDANDAAERFSDGRARFDVPGDAPPPVGERAVTGGAYDMSQDELARIFGATSPAARKPAEAREAKAAAASRPPPVQTWRMVNVSSGGYCLLWREDDSSPAKVGELVGVRNTDDQEMAEWGVGVVRWMRYNAKEGLRIGVEMLAPSIFPVVVERRGGAGMQAARARCLLIPENRANNQFSALLTPAYQLRSDDHVKILQGEHELTVRLGEILENTGFFTQFDFEPLEARRVGQAAESGASLDIDSLFSSL